MFECDGSAGLGLEEDDARLVGLAGRAGEHQARLRLPGPFGEAHLLGELADRLVLAGPAAAEAGGHDDARLHGVDELGRLDGAERIAAADGDDQDVDVAEAVDLVLGELAAQAPGRDDANVVHRDAHHRGLAGGEAEDADAADLELAGTADLLDLTVAGAELGGVGGSLGADDDPDGALGEAGKGRLRRIDDDGHLPAAKPDAGMAVVRQFHEKSSVPPLSHQPLPTVSWTALDLPFEKTVSVTCSPGARPRTVGSNGWVASRRWCRPRSPRRPAPEPAAAAGPPGVTERISAPDREARRRGGGGVDHLRLDPERRHRRAPACRSPRPRGPPPRSSRARRCRAPRPPASTTTPMTLPLPSSSGAPSWRGSGVASTVSTSTSVGGSAGELDVDADRAHRPGGQGHRRERRVGDADREVADRGRDRGEGERGEPLGADRLEQHHAVGGIGADDRRRVAVPVVGGDAQRGRARDGVDARDHQAVRRDHEAVDDAGRPGDQRRRGDRPGDHLHHRRRLRLRDRAGGERAAVVAGAADDGLLGDPLDGPEARVDPPGGEAAADQADHRAQHHRGDEPVARPGGRCHSVGAAARCLR